MAPRARRTLLGLGLGLSIAGWLWWRSQDFPSAEVAATLPAVTTANAPASRAAPDAPAPATRQAVAVAPADEAHVLAGRVVDARTRAPIAGARLSVRDAEAGEGLGGTASEWQVVCDQQGAFRQDLGRTEVVTVEAGGEGHAPRKLPSVVVTTGVEIELHAAPRLVLEVRLDRNGDDSLIEPLPNARCRLVLDGGSASRRTIQFGTTDARGEVVFALRDRQAHVVVETPNVPTFGHIYQLETGQERLRVVLKPVGVVAGRVIDKRTRQPIAGATVETTRQVSLRSVTDNDGRFRIVHDHTANGLWTVSHPNYATVHLRVFPQKSADAPVPDIELEAGAELVGRVDGFAGEVHWSAVSTKTRFGDVRFQQSGTLTEQGPMRVTGVPPRETLVIEARDRQGQVGTVTTRVALAGETIDFGTLVPVAPATVHGQLLGLDPRLPAMVRVQCRRGDLILRDVSRAVRGAEYRITGLPSGSAELWVEQEGAHGIVAKAAPSSGGDLALDLDLGGKIRGVVRDEAGAGIADAVVLVNYTRDNVINQEAARTDVSGRFVCAGLDRAASHRVSMFTSWPDRTVLPKEIKDVIPEARPVEFTARRATLAVTGSVDAAILGEIKVSRLRVHGSRRSDRVSGAVRDDGSFTLPVPDPGPWTLELHAIDESGESLGIGSVPGVDPLRDVNPGDPVLFRRK